MVHRVRDGVWSIGLGVWSIRSGMGVWSTRSGMGEQTQPLFGQVQRPPSASSAAQREGCCHMTALLA